MAYDAQKLIPKLKSLGVDPQADCRIVSVEEGLAIEAWLREDVEQPTEEEVAAYTPGLPSDEDGAKSYALAYQAAQGIIFLLMSQVSKALVIGRHFTPETVNAEGSRFTRYHQAEIEAFKLAGRHPDAGDALYKAVDESAGLFPWLKKADNIPWLKKADNILAIFAATLPRNPK